MHRRLAILVLLAAALGLAGCQQARCVWDGARTQVVRVLQPECPPPCPPVVVTPVYEPLCGGTTPLGAHQTGAFAPPERPR